MANAPLLTRVCHYQPNGERPHEFGTVDSEASYCCDRHRAAHWRQTRKRAALVDLIMTAFALPDGVETMVVTAVTMAPDAFEQWAKWRGYTYHTKRYLWRMKPCRSSSIITTP